MRIPADALNAPSRQSATFPLAVVAAKKNLHRHRELHCVPNLLLFDLRAREESRRLMEAGYKGKGFRATHYACQGGELQQRLFTRHKIRIIPKAAAM